MATITKGRACGTKQRFPSRKTATSAMRSYVRKSGAWLGSYNVYPCKFGNHYHYGHKPRRR